MTFRESDDPEDTQPTTDSSVPIGGASTGLSSQGPAIRAAVPMKSAPGLASPTLALLAEIVDDLERTRIANENRLRQLTRTEADSDGVERGFGLDESHPDVARLAGIVEGLGGIEHDAVLGLQRAMRKHPLGPWAKAHVGVGDKQAARLLAAIGDPYWNTLHNRPRTVSQLWAYCGLHVLPAGHGMPDTRRTGASGEVSDPGHMTVDAHPAGAGVAPKRRKGQRANWSGTAKMRAHLIAERCIQFKGGCDKNGRPLPLSPFRKVYDDRRAHTAVTHPDWTDGHSHNDALRVTSKAILKALWCEARRLSEPQEMT